MRPTFDRLLVKSTALAALALLGLSFAAPASADGRAQPGASACAFVGGGLADPAETQRCLAERFKAPKPKPPAHQPPTNSAPSSSTAPPSSQGS